jgi:hypothetical protein
MNEALLGWVGVLFLFFWRWYSKRSDWLFQQVPEKRHILLQWYTWTGLCLLFSVLRTFYDIYKYEYKGAHYLDPDILRETMDRFPYVQTTEIPNWLRWLSIAAPVLGMVGFLIAMMQCLNLIRLGRDTGGRHRWRLCKTVDQLLVILGVPMVFIVMSMRGLIRAWAVMTGSYCWFRYSDPCGDDTEKIQNLKSGYEALGTMDMELATAFQYFAMWEFASLCGWFMGDKRLTWQGGNPTDDQQVMREYRLTVRRVSILAVYAFVVVGMFKSVFDLVIVVLLQVLPQYGLMENSVVQLVDAKASTMFMFATILCVINMFLISKMRPLQDALGNVTLKFHGTRMMLLVTQIQPKLLNAITADTDVFLKLQGIAQKHSETVYSKMQEWTFNDEQAALTNMSLVLCWCFLIATFNACSWRFKSGLSSRFWDNDLDNDDLRRPLNNDNA